MKKLTLAIFIGLLANISTAQELSPAFTAQDQDRAVWAEYLTSTWNKVDLRRMIWRKQGQQQTPQFMAATAPAKPTPQFAETRQQKEMANARTELALRSSSSQTARVQRQLETQRQTVALPQVTAGTVPQRVEVDRQLGTAQRLETRSEDLSWKRSENSQRNSLDSPFQIDSDTQHGKVEDAEIDLGIVVRQTESRQGTLNLDTESAALAPTTQLTTPAQARVSTRKPVAGSAPQAIAETATTVKATKVTSQKKKRQAGAWWMFMLPFLWLPLLGWYVWRSFKIKAHFKKQAGRLNSMTNVKSVPFPTGTETIETTGTGETSKARTKEVEKTEDELETASSKTTEFGSVPATPTATSTHSLSRRNKPEEKSSSNRTESRVRSGQRSDSDQPKSEGTRTAVSTKSDATSTSKDAKSTSAGRKDDLTRIQGINSETAEILNRSGICTFDDLQATQPEWLQKMLKVNGVDRELNDPSNWPTQAGFAVRGDWDGLTLWHENHEVSAQETETASETETVETETVSEQASERADSTNVKSPSSVVSSQPKSRDDLTKIHGIGAATCKLLHRYGFRSYGDLESAKPEALQEILEIGGADYLLNDPSTWSEQAGYAVRSDWDGLKRWHQRYESSVDSVVDSDNQQSDLRESQSVETSQTEQVEQPEKNQTPTENHVEEDLTVINGIGPATQKLLNAAGVYSFQQIAQLSGPETVELIEKTQPGFRAVRPLTWAAQAQQLLSDAPMTDADLESNLIADIKDISESVADSTTQKQNKTQREKQSK